MTTETHTAHTKAGKQCVRPSKGSQDWPIYLRRYPDLITQEG
jgi:hypothetical protein